MREIKALTEQTAFAFGHTDPELLEALASGSLNAVSDILNSAVLSPKIEIHHKDALFAEADNGDLHALFTLLVDNHYLEFDQTEVLAINNVVHEMTVNALIVATLKSKEFIDFHTNDDDWIKPGPQSCDKNYLQAMFQAGFSMSKFLLKETEGADFDKAIQIDLTGFHSPEIKSMIQEFVLNNSANLAIDSKIEHDVQNVKRIRI